MLLIPGSVRVFIARDPVDMRKSFEGLANQVQFTLGPPTIPLALQLHWVPDELFTRPDVYKQVFAPLGIGYQPVLNTSRDHLETVVQLSASTKPLDAVLPDASSTRCGACGRVKFEPIVRGMFPPQDWEAAVHFTKTKQYFGSGASAWRALVVSQTLARAIQQAKLKGITFRPVAMSSERR